MDTEIYNRLDELSRDFYDRFKLLFNDLDFYCKYLDRLVLTIPAKNNSFGEITIWLDGDEITVGLGEYFHTHFERYSLGEDILNPTVREDVVLESLEFIKDVLNDRIILTAEMLGDKLISSSIGYVDDDNGASTTIIPVGGLLKKLIPQKKELIRNTWSKPYKNTI